MKRFLILAILGFLGSSTVLAQKMSVMSYNIHIGQNSANHDQLMEIARYIKNSKVDIIGLQEVDSVCNRSGKVDQMKFLAEQTGMYYAYARHFAFDGGSYGLGVLSRYPLIDIKDLRISLSSSGKPETRSLLTVEFIKGRTKFTFATVHMDYRDSRSRQVQSEEIVKIFSESKNPIILTGDFNAKPGTKELETLESFFTDVTKLSGPTYPAIKPKNKIDFILVKKGLIAMIKKQDTGDVVYSDHLPVVAVFKVMKSYRN
ncbi:MAG TPA: endonuclease/exonuclease/phosphatase family protein [Daejeonella sp.]|uniref:endonuclease/exonuclease/phosphatase family protein n=1 Tax=Daejeonella sp. TaxID=2805397 RepID=UPI002EDBB088